MKVYIVTETMRYESSNILRVFSDRERAREYMHSRMRTSYYPNWVEITEDYWETTGGSFSIDVSERDVVPSTSVKDTQ